MIIIIIVFSIKYKYIPTHLDFEIDDDECIRNKKKKPKKSLNDVNETTEIELKLIS